jgi:outer membrane protein TolC
MRGHRVVALCFGLLCAAVCVGCSVPLRPLTSEEIDVAAKVNLSTVTADQEPVHGPIDLYEAMARALKYNLDYHVEAVQTALRVAELDLSHFNMLPNAVSSTGYAARNNYDASSSLNLVTGVPNFGASTSTEKDIRTADIEFSWNILDFGLSYVRARQAADKVLIGEELQRKVTQRIIEDVRTAYWRAVSAQRLVNKLRTLEVSSQTALDNARAVSSSRQASPISALTYERELVEIRRTIKDLQRELVVAQSQLAALMNLPPGTPFTLAVSRRSLEGRPAALRLDWAINVAIRNRPELRENMYQQRINVHESHAALLELLPGLQPYSGLDFDSNDFLLNNDWVSWGAKASWNLLKVFSYPAKSNVIETQQDLLAARARALTMAIMTQVHVSRIRYRHFVEELKVASEYRSVQNRLVAQIRQEAAAERVSQQTVIREELNALIGEAKYDIAYAGMQSAIANMYASMGIDGDYAYIDRSASVATVAAQLRNGRIEQGNFDFLEHTAGIP